MTPSRNVRAVFISTLKTFCLHTLKHASKTAFIHTSCGYLLSPKGGDATSVPAGLHHGCG